MRSICFYFQVHQPFRLRTYRFFDIGEDHHYFDDYSNRYILRKVAQKCYLPTNQVMLDLIKEYGSQFKISYSLSGTVIDQFEMYAPEVIESFQRLAETGCVEFLAETYSHSLSALKSKEEFFSQVSQQSKKIEQLFGQKPKTFRNTELIYSDQIGEMVAEMGFKTMLTEGAKHVLGWKSPNYMYCNAINPKLKLLLKNFQLSDDIAFRFSQSSWSDWPLTTEKFVGWLNEIDPNQEVVNLFMDYETFGEHQWEETGIFNFLRALPNQVFSNSNFKFHTPGELSELMQPVSPIYVPYPMSWADEERDLTAWLGNELQDEAFDNLYALEEQVKNCTNEAILKDWKYLQTSDHFYYMCTKWFSDGDVHKYFNPYNTPYEAFINFMNILSDFKIRLNESNPQMPKAVERAAEIIHETATESQPTIAEKEIQKKKPRKTYNFTDIASISNADLKKILKSLTANQVSLALRDADPKIHEKMLKNISKTLLKDLSINPNEFVKKTDIDKSRKFIENLIKEYFK